MGEGVVPPNVSGGGREGGREWGDGEESGMEETTILKISYCIVLLVFK